MKSIQSLFLRRIGCRLGVALIAAALFLPASDAQAALRHRYSFTSDVTDSVGSANGTIQGGAFVLDGKAQFPGSSNEDYIELPPGLITNYTSVTFEFWTEVFDVGIWSEIFAFGNQTAAGEGANMVMFTPHTGSTPPDFRMSYAQAAPGFNDERVVNGSGVLDNLGQIAVTCVYDPPNSAMSLYTNGTLVATLSPVPSTGNRGFSLTNVINARSWLGRSLYNADAPFAGTIDEFRIYDEALGPLRVLASAQSGPDTLVTDIAINSLTWNAQSNMVVGTKQATTITFNTADFGSVTVRGSTEATYSSSDPSVIQVDGRGELRALKVGSATVSAVSGGTTNSITIDVTEPSLVHRYTFASNANDSVGTAHGTLQNGAAITDGEVVLPGGTTSADPGTAYVDLPNNLLTNFTAITVEAWFTDTGSGTWARIWDLGNSAGGEDIADNGSRYMFLTLPNGAGNLAGNIRINDRGGDHTVEWVGNRPPVGEEAHVVWSTDGANTTAWLYVNGALVGIHNDAFVTPADIGTSLNNWLGRSQYGGDASFTGSINEFRIYDGPISPLQIALNAASGPDNIITDPGAVQSLNLTIGTNVLAAGGLTVQAQLLANFQSVSNVNIASVTGVSFISSAPDIVTVSPTGLLNALGTGTVTITASYQGQSDTLDLTVSTLPGYTPATLVHRYSFSETGGTTVEDSVGTADGTVRGPGATFGGGELTLAGGTASNAEEVAGHVDLPNHIINVLKDLSIELWVTWQGSGNWQRIFDFGTSVSGEDISDGNGGYLFLTPQADAGDVRFAVRDPETGTETPQLRAPPALPSGQEVFVAITYDFAHNISRLYKDGVLVASGTAPLDLSLIDDVNVWLGRSQWPDNIFQGKYNEFRIWNGVLLPSEIATHRAAGPDSLEPGPSDEPELSAVASGGNILISWPESVTGFNLQSSPALGAGANWTPVTTAPATANGLRTVSVPIGTGTQFFRLAQ